MLYEVYGKCGRATPSNFQYFNLSIFQFFKTMKRRDLALQYFPHLTPKAAVRKLTMWINGCKELKAELCKRRDIARIQDFTVREVKLIKQYLDDP